MTSAAERPSLGWMPVGIPRPLSATLTELSAWMVTVILSQCPASASSMALSNTSNTMWCRPLPSCVSPIYIPGRLRTASKPSSTWMLSAPYSSCFWSVMVFSLIETKVCRRCRLKKHGRHKRQNKARLYLILLDYSAICRKTGRLKTISERFSDGLQGFTSTGTAYLSDNTAAPAFATLSSSSTEPPLTPTLPTITPFLSTSSTPPGKITKPSLVTSIP